MLELRERLKPRQALPSDDSEGSHSRPTRSELIARIRTGLGPMDRRRVGLHHADVLATMLGMKQPAPDVHGIYKSLLEAHLDMPMSKVYRALKLLEDSGMVQRAWMTGDGRVRSVFCTVDRLAEAALDRPAASVCTHCGASISSDSCDPETDKP